VVGCISKFPKSSVAMSMQLSAGIILLARRLKKSVKLKRSLAIRRENRSDEMAGDDEESVHVYKPPGSQPSSM
ncbi:hypothetical protein AB4144_58420, partial [Rhizobiaceae sp. 2RAB30]